MKKYLALILFALTFVFASPALADDEVRNLVVDLKAKGFTQINWFDNLDSSNIIFAPNDKFQVQLKISNLGNRNQTQVVIKQTLPASVMTDSPAVFTLSQIAAGQDYVKNITVTVKDKSFINKALTANTLRFDAKSEIGTQGGDYTTFYTSNGTKNASTSATPIIPNTGSNSLVLGSVIAGILALAAVKLRRFARGY
jgi:hypothetical protein